MTVAASRPAGSSAMATRSPGSRQRRRAGVGVEVRPVTAQRWDDFARLFEAKGSPHYCWCTPFRVRGNPDLTSAEKKEVTRRLVGAATPIGVLAYADGEPVGWCSIAPRESLRAPGKVADDAAGHAARDADLDGPLLLRRAISPRPGHHGRATRRSRSLRAPARRACRRGLPVRQRRRLVDPPRPFQRLRRRRLSPGRQALVPRARARAIAAIASIIYSARAISSRLRGRRGGSRRRS